MAIHSFTLVLKAEGAPEDIANLLYEHGCDDALVGIQEGRTYAAFTRRGATVEDAIAAARCDVEAAGITVLHAEPEDDE
jgi:hypothetical protein